MLVKNNEKRVIVIADEHRLVRMLPGGNEVPDEQWARIRGSVEVHIKEGSLIEVGAEIKKAVGKEPATIVGKKLKDLTPSEAESLIEKTYDVELLTDWRKQETRDAVRAALANQIDKMKERKSGKDK